MALFIHQTNTFITTDKNGHVLLKKKHKPWQAILQQPFCTEAQLSNLIGYLIQIAYWLAQCMLVLYGNRTIAMTHKSSYGRPMSQKWS